VFYLQKELDFFLKIAEERYGKKVYEMEFIKESRETSTRANYRCKHKGEI